MPGTGCGPRGLGRLVFLSVAQDNPLLGHRVREAGGCHIFSFFPKVVPRKFTPGLECLPQPKQKHKHNLTGFPSLPFGRKYRVRRGGAEEGGICGPVLLSRRQNTTGLHFPTTLSPAPTAASSQECVPCLPPSMQVAILATIHRDIYVSEESRASQPQMESLRGWPTEQPSQGRESL